MKKEFRYLILIGILNFFLFISVFILLQQKSIYNHTLGLISENYERSGNWDNYEIKKVAKPFVQVTNEKLDTWDASIYKCISESMYSLETTTYVKVRPAFFPLFPMFWKITHSSALAVSILNYLIYIFSVAILVVFLLNTSLLNKVIVFAILISIPSSINYCIPYSESLFLLTTTLAMVGITQKKYWLFFIGCFLLSMVRPATVFVFFAILLAEFVIFIQQKEVRIFIKEIALKLLPFMLGYCTVIFIQYLYTDSWTALFDARKYWTPVVAFDHFSDWSVEGFGLSIFAMCFICLPGIVFILSLIFFKRKTSILNYLKALCNYKNAYLFFISIIYLIGICVFSLSTQGFDFHSFSRYILSSPLFYIVVLIMLNYLDNKPLLLVSILYCTITLLTVLFLRNVEYGGDKIQFSFVGLYLFIITGAYLLMKNRIPLSFQICMALGIILLNSVWNTYLLNIFLCNGWIFT
jgi:hypothetical protein